MACILNMYFLILRPITIFNYTSRSGHHLKWLTTKADLPEVIYI